MSSIKLASVILAAGQGTRMKSDRAKVMLELAGDPLVSYPIRLARELSADPIVLVIGHQREQVRAAVDARFEKSVRFAEQLEQKGTGHAVMEGMKALSGWTGRVLILYGDVPLLSAETVRRLLSSEKPLSIVTTELTEPKGYGRIVRDAAGHILKVVEEKDATDSERTIKEINAGIYAVESEFLRSALARLKNENAQKEYYLTDIIALSIADGHPVDSTLVEDPGEVIGANTRGELAHLESVIRRRTNERLMREGVSIIDPDRTYISPRARVGKDTIVHPNVAIRGSAVIGERCVIDLGAVITDAVVGPDVEIKPYSVIEGGASVQQKAIIGPFSRLRPGADIAEGAHVGNFVELKNAKLGKGAKANHLAYLGDATIGAGSNIGAGTITCNYDGYGKYQTTIGENVFIGSNATLVAPVKIGKDAYVAAGSAITEDVGESDLAFGRARQETKKDRAAAIREKAKAKAADKKNK
jgi:bifunctional UDP-N-acetylglucosamine pyrophosphorylase/glucosamine-1-phosphate N-acetyltransferase